MAAKILLVEDSKFLLAALEKVLKS